MFTYELFINYDKIPTNLNGIKLYDLSVRIFLGNTKRVIEETILTNIEILNKSKKVNYFAVKNTIYDLKEILTLSVVALKKRIEYKLNQIWDGLDRVMDEEQILDIVVRELQDLTREEFDSYERLDDLLLNEYAYVLRNNIIVSQEESYNTTLLLRVFYYYQIHNSQFITLNNLSNHYESMKEYAINNWINRETVNGIFTSILDRLIDNYIDSLDNIV